MNLWIFVQSVQLAYERLCRLVFYMIFVIVDEIFGANRLICGIFLLNLQQC